jgi:uncharacterized protein
MFNNTTLKLAVALAAISLHTHVFSAGFDCNKAKTKVEFMICGNPMLSAMDKQMSNQYYSTVNQIDKYDGKDYDDNQMYTGRTLAQFKTSAKTDLASFQKKWLIKRNKCIDTTCLIEAYEDYTDSSFFIELSEGMAGI